MDLLGDYKSYSKGNLTYEFYNPTGEGDTSLEKKQINSVSLLSLYRILKKIKPDI